MASPFSYFRKHAHILMVALVVLSMFAFTMDSLLTADGANYPLLGMLFGGTLMTVIGYWGDANPTKAVKLGVIGACVGGVLFYLIPRGTVIAADSGSVATKAGTYTKEDINALVQKRNVANQFLAMIGSQQQFTVGYSMDVERDVVVGDLLRQKADELGVGVSDGAVSQFLKQQSGNRLTSKQFRTVLDKFQSNTGRMTESELYDIIRDEMKSSMALRLVRPFRHESDPPPTPDVYWDLYKRMNVTQELVTAAIPVDAFIDQVPEPNDQQLTELFEKYKTQFPNEEKPGSPGFRQPRKMSIAYLEADYETIESGLAAVSDDDVKEFYEKNKERDYTNNFLPDNFEGGEVPESPNMPPMIPQMKDSPFPGGGNPGPPPAIPPTETRDETPADKTTEGETESAKPVDDGKPEPAASSGSEESTGEVEKTDESTEGESTEDESDEGSCDFFPQDESSDEQPAQDESSDQTAGKEESTTTDEKAAASTEETATENAAAADDKTGAAADSDTEKKADDPPPKYRPLDATLMEEIRDRILRERGMTAVITRINSAVGEMRRLDDVHRFQKITEGVELDPVKVRQTIGSEMKKFAAASGLKYVETGLQSYAELSDFEENPIGGAIEPMENAFEGNARTVADKLFTSREATPYFPEQAVDQLTSNRFAYWVIDQSKSLVPTLETPGVRAQVVKAWKMDQARPLAEKRAVALAAKADAAVKDGKLMADALGDQTVNGKDGAQVSIRESARFAWMRQSAAPGTSFPMQSPPELTEVAGLEGAANGFMRKVFDEMDNNQIGAVVNDSQSIYYVVQVKDRTPVTEDKLTELREKFMSSNPFSWMSPVPMLVRGEQLRLNTEWTRKLEETYGLDWTAVEADRDAG